MADGHVEVEPVGIAIFIVKLPPSSRKSRPCSAVPTDDDEERAIRQGLRRACALRKIEMVA